MTTLQIIKETDILIAESAERIRKSIKVIEAEIESLSPHQKKWLERMKEKYDYIEG